MLKPGDIVSIGNDYNGIYISDHHRFVKFCFVFIISRKTCANYATLPLMTLYAWNKKGVTQLDID